MAIPVSDHVAMTTALVIVKVDPARDEGSLHGQ